MKAVAGKLLDAASIQREYGVKRAGADAIMRQVPSVRIPGLAKVYVYRRDVDKLLEDCTLDDVTDWARRRRVA